MRIARLVPHPVTRDIAVSAIEVALDTRSGLALRYRLACEPAALKVPAAAAGNRRDGLWQHTCCELFVADARGAGYREFNFSPSGEWAAYRFDAYREGMRALDIVTPRIVTRAVADGIVVEASLGADAFDAAPGSTVRIALCCVTETRDGSLGYWALAHPGERPDFHHADGFALELETG